MTSLYTFLSAGTDNPDSCVPQMQPIRKEYGEGNNFFIRPVLLDVGMLCSNISSVGFVTSLSTSHLFFATS